MNKKIICVIASFFALTPLAYAQTRDHYHSGIFIEPMATYENLDSKVNFPAPFGTEDGESEGFGVGLRLGGHVYKSVFLGLDGRYGWTDFSSGNYSADAKTHNYGVVLGAQLPTPISVRIWGTYIFGGEFDPDRASDVDLTFESGEGYRLGAGLMLGLISLNVEYQRITFDKAVVESIGPFSPNDSFSNVEAVNEGYVLSVSFPFGL